MSFRGRIARAFAELVRPESDVPPALDVIARIEHTAYNTGAIGTGDLAVSYEELLKDARVKEGQFSGEDLALVVAAHEVAIRGRRNLIRYDSDNYTHYKLAHAKLAGMLERKGSPHTLPLYFDQMGLTKAAEVTSQSVVIAGHVLMSFLKQLDQAPERTHKGVIVEISPLSVRI